MLICDLNCDMGEGIGNDDAIMPYITSANVSCGFHAGNGDTIRHTITLALRYGVRIGAHPSFRDRENFGRKEIRMDHDKLYAIVLEQLIKMDLIAKEKGTVLYHVKPHGALYNMAAREAEIAGTIAQAVKDFNEELIVFGLSGSHIITQSKEQGLKTYSEVFADRTYQDDGSLTPRSQPNALIEDDEQCVQQVLQMINLKTVTTTSGNTIPIVADTICIHGDGKHAVKFARKIREALKQSTPETI
jgi:5-oxoprolinase (ATP-hydrolysing) subunit A